MALTVKEDEIIQTQECALLSLLRIGIDFG